MAYSYKRITIPMSDQEQERLREAARRNYRNPRQQARLILLQALGLADPPDPPRNESRECAKVVETTGGALPLVQS